MQIVLRSTLNWSILLLGLSPSALPCLTFRVVRYLASGAGVEPLFEVDKLFSRSLLNQEWFVVFGTCIRNSHGFILIPKLLAQSEEHGSRSHHLDVISRKILNLPQTKLHDLT